MAKDKGIRLSEKHGVNPALTHCPICGKPMGVALFGRLPGDAEAPHNISDPEPCDECKEHMALGVLFVERDGNKITGSRWVVKEEAARRILEVVNDEMRQDVLARRVCHIDPDAAKMLGFYDVEPD